MKKMKGRKKVGDGKEEKRKKEEMLVRVEETR